MAISQYETEMEGALRAICHDMRAPTRYLSNFVELLVEALGDDLDEECLSFVDFIQKSTILLADQLDSLERVTAAMAVPLVPRPCQLVSLVDEALASLATIDRVGEARVSVAHDVVVVVDPALFVQLIAELLHNAIRFSPEEPIIEIGATTSDGPTVLSFIDHGSGMRPKDAATACDLFSRFHPPGVSGLGAGLTAVRKIAERHEASLTIESCPDDGTRVQLTLPAPPANPAVSAISTERTDAP